jgi:hypothetical protein
MAFSGSTDFTYTRDQTIKAALRKCRAYDADGGAPEPYQIRDAAEALNIILKELQTEGALLWVQVEKELNLAKGKRSYTVGPSGDLSTDRPLRIYNPRRYQISTKESIPMNLYSRADYNDLTNKFTTGEAINVYYDRQITQGVLYVWPVPSDSKYKLNFTAEVPLQDFDASGDDAHMPSYAYRYFVWALAAEIASEYGIPLDESDRWAAKASALRDNLLEFEEEEDGFQMVPDWPSYQGRL